MNPIEIIKKYYDETSDAFRILTEHSRMVAEKALAVAARHPEENFDADFLREAAMLHDIGIFLTDAPRIDCHGSRPYICHGYLGAELLRAEGLPRHALVCERHTGAGLSMQDIVNQELPVPHRDMLPVSKEEQLICYADKFYSKTNLYQEHPREKIVGSLARFGGEAVARFEKWDIFWGEKNG